MALPPTAEAGAAISNSGAAVATVAIARPAAVVRLSRARRACCVGEAAAFGRWRSSPIGPPKVAAVAALGQGLNEKRSRSGQPARRSADSVDMITPTIARRVGQPASWPVDSITLRQGDDSG